MVGIKVIAVSIWLYTASQINVVGGLDCYSCTNAKAICQCTTIETCPDDGGVCFSEYTQAKGYNLGCSNSSQCPSTPTSSTGSGSIIGRSVQDGCFQCCSLDNCNRQLCQAPDPSCTDTKDFDCSTIGSTTNYCYDSHRAQQFCRNYCGLCSLRDGGWSAWSSWTTCDVTCSNGTQTRARACTNPTPTTCGVDCSGSNKETRVCSLPSCPVHGGWSAWSPWGACSVSCHIGIQMRDRYCNSPFPSSDGDYCQGNSRDDRLCTMSACQDGGWSHWTAWTTCSRTCGDGLTSRSRSCTNPKPSVAGSYCSGNPLETNMCRTSNCPDGGWSYWAAWTTCSRTCGDGLTSRSRSCTNPKPSVSGSYCSGNPHETNMCRTRNCPDGGWSPWSSWTSCSRTCGDGLTSRSRSCTQPKPSVAGSYCSGDSRETNMCRTRNCPVTDGGWSPWSSWTSCSRTCGDGLTSRSRSCTQPKPSVAGSYCSGDSRETNMCRTRSCPDGGWSPWSSWTSCSRTCGDGLTSRSRSCTQPKPSVAGSYCSGDPRETNMCRTRNCPAKVSAFTADHPTGTTIIKFAKIITNIGNDYSSSTGRFTCEYPGLYYFAVSLTKIRSNNEAINDFINNYLSVNGVRKVYIYIDPTDDDTDHGSYEASGTLTVHLSKGDYVDVGQGTHADHMAYFSQFSGFLILPDS